MCVGFRPDDSGAGEGIDDGFIQPGAARAVVGDRGCAQFDPISNLRQAIGRLKVYHRCAVARAEAIERTSQEQATLS
jgi:hypothetical protein